MSMLSYLSHLRHELQRVWSLWLALHRSYGFVGLVAHCVCWLMLYRRGVAKFERRTRWVLGRTRWVPGRTRLVKWALRRDLERYVQIQVPGGSYLRELL